MPPRKRKSADQPKLEQVTDQPVKVTRARKGALAEAETDARPGSKRAPQADPKGQPAPDHPKKAEAKPEEGAKEPGERSISEAGIWVNRAPVLTLWVSVVAQRQGFSKDAGLSFGKAISGILAHSKGRSIGVIEPHERDEDERREREDREEALGVQHVDVFGMKIKALKHGEDDVRALDTSETAVDAAGVQRYLQRAFGARLRDAEAVLQGLAESYEPDEIGKHAYDLYSDFRPNIPAGQAGWGKKGLLDPGKIKGLHKT